MKFDVDSDDEEWQQSIERAQKHDKVLCFSSHMKENDHFHQEEPLTDQYQEVLIKVSIWEHTLYPFTDEAEALNK